jgi:hypothetical protein
MAFDAGCALSVIVVALMVFALAIMTRDWRVRCAHGSLHPDFFRESADGCSACSADCCCSVFSLAR